MCQAPSIWQLHTNVPGPLKQHFSYAAIGQSFRTVVSDMATSKNESLVFVVICICTAVQRMELLGEGELMGFLPIHLVSPQGILSFNALRG